jgi:TetR/AcrR family transcriptional repressor of nem operon
MRLPLPAAGASKGSFCNHFASKEDIVLEALSHYAAGLRFGMLNTTERPGLERLRAHFEFLGEDTVDYGFARGCLVGKLGAEVADHSQEIRSAIQQSFHRWASHIRQALIEAKEAGELDPDLDVEATALFILSAWEGTLIAARACSGGVLVLVQDSCDLRSFMARKLRSYLASS